VSLLKLFSFRCFNHRLIASLYRPLWARWSLQLDFSCSIPIWRARQTCFYRGKMDLGLVCPFIVCYVRLAPGIMGL